MAATNAVLYALAPDEHEKVKGIQWSGAGSVALGKRDDADLRQSSVDPESPARPRLFPGGPFKGSCLNFTQGAWTTDCPSAFLEEEVTQTQSWTIVDPHQDPRVQSNPTLLTRPEQNSNDDGNPPTQDSESNKHHPIPPSPTTEKGQLTSRDEQPDDCDPLTFHQFECGTVEQDKADEEMGADNYGLNYCDPQTFHQFDCDSEEDVELQGKMEPKLDWPLPPSSSSTKENERLASRAVGEDPDYCDPESYECGYIPEPRVEKEEGVGPVERRVLVPREFVA